LRIAFFVTLISLAAKDRDLGTDPNCTLIFSQSVAALTEGFAHCLKFSHSMEKRSSKPGFSVRIGIFKAGFS